MCEPLFPSRVHERYRGTSLTRKRIPFGPYRRPMPGVLGGSLRGGRFLMGEVPLSVLMHTSTAAKYAPPAQHTPVQVVNALSKDTAQLNALSQNAASLSVYTV